MEGVVRVVQATGRLSMSAASFAAWASAGVSGVMVTAGDTNGTSRGSASAVATSAGTAGATPFQTSSGMQMARLLCPFTETTLVMEPSLCRATLRRALWTTSRLAELVNVIAVSY